MSRWQSNTTLLSLQHAATNFAIHTCMPYRLPSIGNFTPHRPSTSLLQTLSIALPPSDSIPRPHPPPHCPPSVVKISARLAQQSISLPLSPKKYHGQSHRRPRAVLASNRSVRNPHRNIDRDYFAPVAQRQNNATGRIVFFQQMPEVHHLICPFVEESELACGRY